MEFGAQFKIGDVKRSGGDCVFGKEEILVPIHYELDLTSHAQFLICIWSYGILWKHRRERVLVRLPDSKKWVTTIQPFVDHKQWERVTSEMNLLKKNFLQICKVQQGKALTLKLN